MKMWPGVIIVLLVMSMIGSLGMVWIAVHNPPVLEK
jgi:hypothetical protein